MIIVKVGIDYIGVGCGAFIVNEKNEVLLMKRGKKSKNNVGCWSLPGGAVEFNEHFHDAVKREIFEELGLEIEVLKLLVLADDILPEQGQHWVTPQFLCRIVGGTLRNKEPEKCDEIGWFSVDTFPTPLNPLTQQALNVYLKK
jgi:ADP-ribose pyrophosphatase YjhB (NUDIX family)